MNAVISQPFNHQPLSSNHPQNHQFHFHQTSVPLQDHADAHLPSQAMNGLDFEDERKQQQEVPHDMDQVVEDEKQLNSALQDLDHYLSSSDNNNINKEGTCYELAEKMDTDYVHAEPLRVMFLRANGYNPEASADQMLRFFELKHELFGTDKLTKDITLEDLNEDDMTCLRAGCVQLAGRDHSGRQVIAHFGDLLGSYHLKTWLRVQYFVHMAALKSQETQLRGTVSVWWEVGALKSKTSNKGYMIDSFKAETDLPTKKAATHICVDELYQSVLCNMMIKLLNKSDLGAPEVRVHYGSQMECQYELSTCGISSKALPLNGDGSMNLDSHLHWVHDCCTMGRDKLVQAPSSSSTSSSIELESNTSTDIKPNTGDKLVQAPSSSSTSSSIEMESNTSTDIKPNTGDKLVQAPSSSSTSSKRQQGSNPTTGVKPNVNDVLISGGKVGGNHAGNQLFRALVVYFEHAYNSATDEKKRQKIVNTVIVKVHLTGGHFLRLHKSSKDTTEWKEVPPAELRKKITRAFLNRRRLDNGPFSNGSSVNGTLIADEKPQPGTSELHRLTKDKFEEHEPTKIQSKIEKQPAPEPGKLLSEQSIKDQDGPSLQAAPEPGKLSEQSIKDQDGPSLQAAPEPGKLSEQSIKDQGGRSAQPTPEPGKWFELSHISKYFGNQHRRSLTKTSATEPQPQSSACFSTSTRAEIIPSKKDMIMGYLNGMVAIYGIVESVKDYIVDISKGEVTILEGFFAISALLSIFLSSIVLNNADSNLILDALAYTCLIVGPAAAILQRQVSLLKGLRELTNQMRGEVNRLSASTSVLKTQNSRLAKNTKQLQATQASLEQVSAATGISVAKLVQQVEEFKAVQQNIHTDLNSKIQQTLVSVIIRSDKDEDFVIDPEEVDRLVTRLKHLPGIVLDETKFRRALTKEKGDMEQFMAKHLEDSKVMAKEKIFQFKLDRLSPLEF